NELAGRYLASVQRPARESLEPDMAAVFQTDLRLQRNVDLIGGQCHPERIAGGLALLDAIAKRGIEEAGHAAPACLGLIERDVGVLEQFPGRAAIIREHGDADAAARNQAAVFDI